MRLGEDVKGVRIGDRVGVGAQSGACLKGDCAACSDNIENYCPHAFDTYNSTWPTGEKTSGGYAKYWRGDATFVFAIPEGVDSAAAAPMLCAGATLYSPLKSNGAEGRKVGIVGIGGLGHFGLLWARALGASRVVAISRTDAKKNDALEMGADDFIATSDEGYEKKHANSLDLIVSTISGPGVPLGKYLDLLDIGGQFIQVGAPEDPIPAFTAFSLILKRVKVGGSLIASPTEIREMLQLAAEKKIQPWVNERPMADANQAIIDFEKGLPRYRYVLTN